MPTTFFILAGEASGDHHGAKLIRELKARQADARFVGMGGPKMASAGLEFAKDLEGMQVVGFWEVIKHYGFFRKVFHQLLDRIKQEAPAALICIDYPGFNLRFAKEVRKLGIPVLYYIVPQVWAWKEMRAKSMARFVDKAFCVFEFEAPFFQRFGLKTEYVGHPLMDDTPQSLEGHALVPKFDSPMRTVAFLPGSRENETVAISDPMAKAFYVGKFKDRNVNALMSFPQGSWSVQRDSAKEAFDTGVNFFERMAQSHANVHVVNARIKVSEVLKRGAEPSEHPVVLEGPHSALLPRLADFSVVKSGTSTLEAGLAGNPLCVVYKASPISYFIAHQLVNIPVFSLINIVLGRYAVPELLQSEVNPQRIAQEIERGLFDEKYRDQQRAILAELPKKLGGPGASARTARSILDFIQGKP
jgi:lipid-A-disaccharide synthase